MFFIKLFILPIRFYRYFISPLTPPSCRFEPTCSQYAINSIEEFGVIKGSVMTDPLITPNSSIELIAYWEQVGSNLQDGGVKGEIKYL